MLECVAYTPAVMYMVAGLVLMGLVVFLARYGNRSSTIAWYRTFLSMSAGLYISSAIMKCSQNATEFRFALLYYTLMVALLAPVLSIVTLHFVNKAHVLEKYFVRLALISMGVAFLFVYWQTDLFVDHNFAHTTHGFSGLSAGIGPLSGLVGLALAVTYIVPIIWTIQYQRRQENLVKKKEVLLVTIALTILIIPSLLIEGVLPTVFHLPSLPVSPFASVTMAILLTYAITRYGLHVFSLNNATDNIMQVMPGGLIVLDHTNTIQYLNSGAAQMLGYKSEALTGASARKLFKNAVDYGTFQTDVLGQLAPNKDVAGRESIFTTKLKNSLPVSLNVASVYAGRELVSCFISFTDITRVKQAEAALKEEKATVELKVVTRTRELNEVQAQLTASIRSLPFGFAVIDNRGQILFSNDQLSKLVNLKIPTDQAFSRDTLKQIAAQFKPAIDILACIDDSQSKAHPLERNIGFGPRYFRFYFMPILDQNDKRKKAMGTVLMMEDVTEIKSLERSRDEFFSIASHELRTPLTAIRGNTSMIIDYYKDQLKDPDLLAMVNDVHGASLRLIDIVNDFLDVSRLEMRKFAFENKPTNIATLVRETLREYDVTGSRRKLSLELAPFSGDDPWVNADADRVRQILINLIANGLKFTTEGGVTITLHANGRHLNIEVTDTGKGIPDDSRHLLFRKFQQASNNILTRDNTQSTGLGLYISKMLAEGMHGRLFLLKTEMGKGTTFVLELPKIAAPTVSPAKS